MIFQCLRPNCSPINFRFVIVKPKYSDSQIVLFLQKRDIHDDTVTAISYENERYPVVFEAIIVLIKEGVF